RHAAGGGAAGSGEPATRRSDAILLASVAEPFRLHLRAVHRGGRPESRARAVDAGPRRGALSALSGEQRAHRHGPLMTVDAQDGIVIAARRDFAAGIGAAGKAARLSLAATFALYAAAFLALAF